MQKKKQYDEDWMLRVARTACLELDRSRLSELTEAVGAELCSLSQLTGEGETDWMKQGQAVSAFREDRVGDCLSAEALLSAAPRREGDYFAVPEVLGEGGESS